MDSGLGDYKRFWLTSSLRGAIGFNLRVTCLTKGIHSGNNSGIAPDSFMIIRKLFSRIEDYKDGRIPLLEVDIPPEVEEATRKTATIIGDDIKNKIPILDGVKLMADDNYSLLINNTWKPSLATVGGLGLPPLAIAGNVLRPYTELKVVIRTPPTIDSEKKFQEISDTLTKDPPYKAEVILTDPVKIFGVRCPPPSDKLRASLSLVSKSYFNEDFAEAGEGGSIPFIQKLVNSYPNAQFVVTGLVHPDSNIHGPNENLELTYVKKFICSIAHLLSDYKNYL